MKNLSRLSAILFLIAIFFSSCRKDYVCDCSKTYTQVDGTTFTESDGIYTFRDSKSRASDRCIDQEKTGSDKSGPYTRDCEIR
jgi:hypothetical protein